MTNQLAARARLSVGSALRLLLPVAPPNPLVRIIPPVEEWLIIPVANTMMYTMSFRSTRPTLGQYLVISPLQIHARMYVYQQPDEHHNENCPGEHMRSNDVQAKVCEEDESQAFEYIELIRNLWIDLSMIVMVGVDTGKKRMMQDKVEAEEKRIVDKEASCQLKYNISACGRCSG